MNKTVLTSFTILCLLSTVFPNGLALNIQTVKARTIYIRANGSIDPSDAPISSNDTFTYTLTGNINDSVIVEKGNIVVDGSGYTLQGAGSGCGFYWFDVNNVTIKNTNIEGFEYGVDCISTSLSNISGNNITNSHHGINLYSSSNNNIYGNTVTNSHHGVRLSSSSNNILSGNNITNSHHGVYLSSSSNNTVSANTVTSNNYFGVFFSSSSNNTVSANTVTSNNYFGVYLSSSSNNTVSENTVTNNSRGVGLISSSGNTVSANTITNNKDYGLYVTTSSNNTLSGNIASGSKYNFYVMGSELSHFMHSIDVSNVVDEKPVHYLVNQTALLINPATYPEIGYLALINCANVTVESLILTNNGQGVLLAYTNNSRIANNNITSNYFGVFFSSSSNNTVSENTVTNNSRGLYLSSSSGNTVSANTITNNNDYGLYLRSSSNNTVSANTITNNNDYGLYLSGSSDNRFYHNNFIGNTQQVRIRVPSYADFWDNGVEGNYWSDYTGDDIYSGPYQNETGNDGVGDTLYIIDENNIDHYPLMGMFSGFNTSLSYHVNVVSNSTVEDFIYFESNSTIKMHISNMTTNQTFGFCRVCIPKKLMPPPYTVTINDGLTEVLHFNDTIYDNGTHRWAYFSYEHSTLEIIIIPEFPSLTILPLFMIAMLLAVTVYKRNALQRKKD